MRDFLARHLPRSPWTDHVRDRAEAAAAVGSLAGIRPGEIAAHVLVVATRGQDLSITASGSPQLTRALLADAVRTLAGPAGTEDGRG